jgi:hypothetical protein
MRICLGLAAMAIVGSFGQRALAQDGSSSPYAMPTQSWGMPSSSQSSPFGNNRMNSPTSSGPRPLSLSSLSNQKGPLGFNRLPGRQQSSDQPGSPFRNAQPNGYTPPTGPMSPSRQPGSAPEGNPNRSAGSGIRTELCVAFDYANRDADTISALLTRRLAAMRSIHCMAPIRVEVQGQAALLRGSVETEHDRALAGLIVLLEPGIAAVKNEIAVSAAPKGSTPR